MAENGLALPPGATLVADGPAMRLPPGAKLASGASPAAPTPPGDMATAALAQQGLGPTAGPAAPTITPHPVSYLTGNSVSPLMEKIDASNPPAEGGNPWTSADTSAVSAIAHNKPGLAPISGAIREGLQKEQHDPGNPDWYRNYLNPTAQAFNDFTEGLTTPTNLASMGALGALPAVGKAAQLARLAARTYFGGSMAAGAVKGGVNSYQAAQQGDTPEAVKQGVGGVLSGLMAGYTARGFPGNNTGAFK